MYFLLILPSVLSQSCPSIACGLLKYPKCDNSTLSSRNISSCFPNEYCEYNTTSQMKYCDISPSNLYPGDLCSLDSQCLSGQCNSGLCEGPSYQQPCSLTIGCQPGFYCDGRVCLNQIKPDGQCDEDFQCINSAFCNLGICTLYWSLVNGDEVRRPVNGLSIGCKTGAAVENDEGWICTGTDSSDEIGSTCNSGSTCYSKNKDFSQACVCGHNELGASYCPLFPGDPQVQSAISDSQILFQNNSICNTYSRFSLNCFLAYPELLESFLNFAINYTLSFEGYWALTYNSTNCILQTLNPEYYSLLNAFQNLDDYQPCTAYYCPNNFGDLQPDQCMLSVNDSNYGILQNIQYANDICDWNYTCTQLDLESNGTCEPIVNPPGNPGDFCNETYPCKSNKCYDGFCLGIRENEVCGVPSDCMPGFYCDQTTLVCEKLKSKSTPCKHNYECSNYLLCNLGTCINYFSLQNNENTDIFVDGYSFACSSGFAVPTSNASIYNCVSAPLSKKQNTCKYKNQPCYDNSGLYQHNCTCSFAQVNNGLSTSLYCPPYVGDIYFQNVMSNLKYLLNWNSVCNTLSRLHERCFMRSDDYLGYYYFYVTNLTMFVNYSSIYQVQDCIQRTVMYKEYRNQELLEEWIKNHEQGSGSNDYSFGQLIKPLLAVLGIFNLV